MPEAPSATIADIRPASTPPAPPKVEAAPPPTPTPEPATPAAAPVAAPAEEASAPKAPEVVSAERQGQEVRRLARGMLYRHALDMGVPQNDAQNAIMGTVAINNAVAEGAIPQGGLNDKEGTNPIRVTIDGKVLEIRSITGVNGDNLSCVVFDPVHGISEPRDDIPGGAVLRGQVLSVEQDLIGSSEFTQAERVLLGAWIADLKGEEPPTPSGELNNAIREVATKNAVLTTGDLQAFHQSLVEHDKGRQLSPAEEISQAARGAAAERMAATANIVDRETFTEFFNAAGSGPEQMQQQADLYGRLLGEAQRDLAAHPNDPKLRSDVEQLQARISLHQRAIAGFGEGGAVDTYFNNTLNGTIDVEKSQKLVEAFRAGDMNEVLKSIPGYEDDPKNPEQAKKRAQILGILKEKGSTFGILALLFLVEGFNATTKTH